LVDNGKNGYLYNQGSVKSLVEQLTNYAKDSNLSKEHGETAKRKAERMMEGRYNADELFIKLSAVAKAETANSPRPLNFSHRWLEYPTIATRYIADSRAVALRTLIYHRLRHRGKWLYLTTFRVINFVRRGFKRSSSL